MINKFRNEAKQGRILKQGTMKRLNKSPFTKTTRKPGRVGGAVHEAEDTQEEFIFTDFKNGSYNPKQFVEANAKIDDYAFYGSDDLIERAESEGVKGNVPPDILAAIKDAAKQSGHDMESFPYSFSVVEYHPNAEKYLENPRNSIKADGDFSFEANGFFVEMAETMSWITVVKLDGVNEDGNQHQRSERWRAGFRKGFNKGFGRGVNESVNRSERWRASFRKAFNKGFGKGINEDGNRSERWRAAFRKGFNKGFGRGVNEDGNRSGNQHQRSERWRAGFRKGFNKGFGKGKNKNESVNESWKVGFAEGIITATKQLK